ncbi:hypothetical protein FTX61_06990 [Nitriliruptoraceae bacterium ZYF776]|nr:hypothetical protein [Profundirhabdus halotolerans]
MQPSTRQAADAAREALRLLATSTRDLDDPADVAAVLDVLAGGIIRVRQILDHLADWHERTRGITTHVADRGAEQPATEPMVTDLRDTADALLDAQTAVAMAAGRHRPHPGQATPAGLTKGPPGRLAPVTSFGTTQPRAQGPGLRR